MAQALSYGVLLVLTLLLFSKNPPQVAPRTSGQLALTAGVFAVIAAYAIRGWLTQDVELFRVAVGVTYVALPLAFLLSLRHVAPFANIERFGTVFFVMMIPVHMIGLVQLFVDSQFAVHTLYSDAGGIIVRNSLGGAVFNRLPAIFASADRYAAMAAAHVYLALVVLLLRREKTSTGQGLWFVANLGLGMVGVLIAGARSRVLLVGTLLVVAVALVTSVARKHTMRGSYSGVLLRASLAISVVIGIVGVPLVGQNAFPVIDFLSQTLIDGDISGRLEDAFVYSRLRESTTLLGSGVGTLSPDGTPGEFGIRSLWREMGLLFGTLAVAGFSLIALTLLQYVRASVRRGDAAMTIGVLYPSLVLTSSLFVGLRFSLELSSAVIIAIGLALSMSRENPLRPVRSPPGFASNLPTRRCFRMKPTRYRYPDVA